MKTSTKSIFNALTAILLANAVSAWSINGHLIGKQSIAHSVSSQL